MLQSLIELVSYGCWYSLQPVALALCKAITIAARIGFAIAGALQLVVIYLTPLAQNNYTPRRIIAGFHVAKTTNAIAIPLRPAVRFFVHSGVYARER